MTQHGTWSLGEFCTFPLLSPLSFHSSYFQWDKANVFGMSLTLWSVKGTSIHSAKLLKHLREPEMSLDALWDGKHKGHQSCRCQSTAGKGMVQTSSGASESLAGFCLYKQEICWTCWRGSPVVMQLLKSCGCTWDRNRSSPLQRPSTLRTRLVLSGEQRLQLKPWPEWGKRAWWCEQSPESVPQENAASTMKLPFMLFRDVQCIRNSIKKMFHCRKLKN